tara:strand:- start:54 stop:614 length:561 start_codon:yes stop_codon:yes gene_type:complete
VDFVKSIDNVYNDSIKAIQDASGKILLTHLGEMKPDIITELSEKAETKLFEINAAKKNIKNIFNVLIEGLQNIKNHGEFSPDNHQISFFHMYDLNESFICNFSNLIDNNFIEKVSQNIDHLNTLERPELKALYLETLTNGQISKKGGAGLGIIIMAMKSKNKIDYKTFSIDSNLSILSLDIRVTKA